MNYLKLVPVLLAVSFGAWAQQDPRINATVVSKLVPNEVSLSRVSTAKSKEFIGQAAFMVTVSNNTTNVLNRTTFTASTAVLKAGSPISDVAPFDSRGAGPTILVYPLDKSPDCVISGVDSNALTCVFGGGPSGGTLNPGDRFVFIVLVQSPKAGDVLNLNWQFGGFEGSGVGNGCCAQVGTVSTTLVDPVLADSVKTHVQSFVARDTITSVFTGVDRGATKDDPRVTIADLGSGFTVPGQVASTPYVQSIIDEKSNNSTNPPPELSSCNPSDKNVCWKSQVTIQDPNTEVGAKWSGIDGNFLYITLERHSSIIKGGTKLTDYANGFYYSSDGVSFGNNPIPFCSSSLQPVSGIPCLEAKDPTKPACVELPDPTKASAFVWRCTVKARDNGVYLRR